MNLNFKIQFSRCFHIVTFVDRATICFKAFDTYHEAACGAPNRSFEFNKFSDFSVHMSVVVRLRTSSISFIVKHKVAAIFTRGA